MRDRIEIHFDLKHFLGAISLINTMVAINIPIAQNAVMDIKCFIAKGLSSSCNRFEIDSLMYAMVELETISYVQWFINPASLVRLLICKEQ